MATNRRGNAAMRSVSAIMARANEIRDGQRNPPRPSLPRQKLVDEAMRIAGERDDEVLQFAIAFQGRIVRKRMSSAHGDDETLLVEHASMEARRNVAGGDDGNVDGACLQIGE